MSDDKKRRKQQHLKTTDQVGAETSIEKETGILDSDFYDTSKIRKLAYMLVIQNYLRTELEQDIRSQHWKNAVKRATIKKP